MPTTTNIVAPTLAARDAAFARFEARREGGLIPASVDFSDWLLANDPRLWDAVAGIEEASMPCAPHITTPDKLAQLVRPFVGTGRSIHRGGSALDILHTMHSVDASVSRVDASGLELVRDGFAQVVPWASVRSITIRAGGAETVYENAAAIGYRFASAGSIAA